MKLLIISSRLRVRFERIRFHMKARSLEGKALVYFDLAVLVNSSNHEIGQLQQRGPGFGVRQNLQGSLALLYHLLCS